MSAAVTLGSHPATLRDEDYPWGSTLEDHEGLLAMIKGDETFAQCASLLEMVGPSEADDLSVRHRFRVLMISAATLAEQYEGIRSLGPVNIRGLLGTVQAPVLVLHRTGDRAADVRAAAGVGEILCSRTVKDLVAGAGYAFADRGAHRLKVVPDAWQLYAVELAAT